MKLSSEDREAIRKRELATAGECTRCHYVGTQSCQYLVPASIGEDTYISKFLSASAQRFPGSHWMPPDAAELGEGVAGKQAFEKKYRLAIEALKSCCKDPTQTVDVDGVITKICDNPFPPKDGAKARSRGDGH